jgi:hypothetical protein
VNANREVIQSFGGEFAMKIASRYDLRSDIAEFMRSQEGQDETVQYNASFEDHGIVCRRVHFRFYYTGDKIDGVVRHTMHLIKRKDEERITGSPVNSRNKNLRCAS